ncbi:DUF433 domain-containing protein [Spirosoma luteum]
MVDRMSYGKTIDAVLESYPPLTREEIVVSLRYAAYISI